MNIISMQIEKSYERHVEKMGTGLVLFKISAARRIMGLCHHLYFENGKKPPLDIAINPSDGTVEYVSFFLQDEKCELRTMPTDIIHGSGQITIQGLESYKNPDRIRIQRVFSAFADARSVFLLSAHSEKVLAYDLTSRDSLLFTESNYFCGIVLRDLTSAEYHDLETAQVI